MGSERNICDACYDELPWSKPVCLPVSGVMYRRIAMLHYSFPVDAALKALKFHRKLYYASAFGEVLCDAGPYLPKDIDAVMPVPLHWRRKMFRGFNQATELAIPIARLLGVPTVRYLRRKKATPFQSGLNARQRAANLRQAFRAVAIRDSVRRHILIVDDVVTTGATTEAVGMALLAAGIEKVSVLSVAVAR